MSLTPAVQKLLSILTPEELDTLLSKLTAPRSTMKVDGKAYRGKGKKAVRVAPVVKINTRPLNSFIAFRSYYSSLFANFQQKEISGLVTSMWREDPFKAKWSIIARSYSLVRDTKGKGFAPLHAFLAMSAPLMAIIEPAQYLSTMGWDIAVAEDGQTSLLRTNTSVDERLFTTNLSVNDLISHSYQQGYFTGNLIDVLLSENKAVMAMAASVQPTTIGQFTLGHNAEENDTDVTSQYDVKDLDDEEGILGKTVEFGDLAGDVDLAPNRNIAAPATLVESESHNTSAGTNDGGAEHYVTGQHDSEATAPIFASPLFGGDQLNLLESTNIGTESFNAQLLPGASAIASSASTLTANNFHLEGEYPFNMEFDPETASFTYDPFMGNQFDVFEMSDASWVDTFNLNAYT